MYKVKWHKASICGGDQEGRKQGRKGGSEGGRKESQFEM